MKSSSPLSLIAPLLLSLLLSGCAAPLIIGGAAAGAAIANDRRTAGTILDDQGIELQTLDLVAADKVLIEQCRVHATSYNGILLLTGRCANSGLRERVSELAGRVVKVRQVHNELRIAPPDAESTRAHDTLVTTRVKSEIIADPLIEGLHVKVVTDSGIVYLMGLLTPAEGRLASSLAAQAKGAKRVIKVIEYIDPPQKGGN